MKLLRVLLIPLLAVSLGGCADQLNKLGGVISAATTTFVNPVGPVQMYQVNNVYAAGQELVLEYKDKCFGVTGKKTLKTINADAALRDLCKRRVSRWYAMQAAENKAYISIKLADKFIKENPSGNAATYIAAAWKAANEFRAQASK